MLVLYILGVILLTAIDQLSKWLVCWLIPHKESVVVIKNIFCLTHHQNKGAALGLLQGQQWLFFLVTVAVVVVVTAYILKKRPTQPWLVTSLTLIVGGGIGNFIDRLFRGYVVDFLDFSDIYFPYIFNLADCFIVCGAFLLAAYIIFVEGKTNQVEKKKKAE